MTDLLDLVEHHSNFIFKENSIYCGDCETVMKHFPDECVDLIYIDPPFFTNKKYEVIWNDGAEIRAYEDRWKGMKNHYIKWLKSRVKQCHRLLKETGSIYVHCDWHVSHHIRVMLDEIFGYNNFRNEIIWSYGARGGKSVSNQFGRTHDNIFYYVKSKKATFNKIYITKAIHIKDATKHGYRKDEEGKWFKSAPASNHTKKRISELEKEGRIYYTKNGNPRVKYFLEIRGDYIINNKTIGSVWDDIPDMMHTSPSERMGYPTQKPEALLERIISASSNEGDLILDPMAGCGTAISVAHKLNRKWIGIDISPTACKLMVTQRIYHMLTPNIYKIKNNQNDNVVMSKLVNLFGYPLSIEELKLLKSFEFENIICDAMNAKRTKKTNDMGVDGFTENDIPIQIKKRERVGRDEIDKFKSAVERLNKKHGIIIAFSFTKGAYEEVARLKENNIIDIELSDIYMDGHEFKIRRMQHK